jgi:ketosteroid isomerase-like protein
MTRNDPKSIVDNYFKAWTTGDFDTARSLLCDDVSFQGPLERFDNADAFITSLKGLFQIVEGAEEQKVFVDGDDVCVIYDLVTVPAGTSPTVDWYHLRDGKISAVRVFFDARPFAAMFEQKH